MNYSKDKAKANRGKSATEVLAAIKADLPDVWIRAKVVGRWVWIHFDAKPADSVRAYLLELGFHWNKTRSNWQHSCGHYSTFAKSYDPRDKYIVRRADELQVA